MRRALVQTPLGLIHYTATGGDDGDNGGVPIMAFHMSPRSADEFKEVQELSSSHNNRLFVAIDEPGFGQSDIPNNSCTIDEIADCYLYVMDHLGIDKCVAVGSLKGCYLALSLASRFPERVVGVVLTNLYYYPETVRQQLLLNDDEEKSQSTIKRDDPWKLEEDGSHISKIWEKRKSWGLEIKTRASFDEFTYHLKRRQMYFKNIYVQDDKLFDLKRTSQNIVCPLLCIQGEEATQFFDKIGYDMSGQFSKALLNFEKTTPLVEVIPGHLCVVNESAEEWHSVVTNFIESNECCV
jgi:pimeloyl-ACP methyl ester carboxylesterase